MAHGVSRVGRTTLTQSVPCRPMCHAITPEFLSFSLTRLRRTACVFIRDSSSLTSQLSCSILFIHEKSHSFQIFVLIPPKGE